MAIELELEIISTPVSGSDIDLITINCEDDFKGVIDGVLMECDGGFSYTK